MTLIYKIIVVLFFLLLTNKSSDFFQLIASIIQAFSGCISVAVSVAALVIAGLVEKRTAIRFSEQLKREESIALANVKPLIFVHCSKFINHKAITLSNKGLGTAIISEISFIKKDEIEKNTLINFIKFKQEMIWDYYWRFKEEKYYIEAGHEIILLKLTTHGLSKDGIEENEATLILSDLQKQWEGIKIQIKYSDILGNTQPDYEIILTN